MEPTSFSDLSLSSQIVLYSVLASLAFLAWKLIASICIYLKQLLWKPRKRVKSTKHKVNNSAASSIETRAQTVQQKTTPSKHPATRSKPSKSKKQEEGKILEHPLYILSLKDHRDRVNGFGWAHDGSALASACEDRCVRLFTFSDTIDKGVSIRQINIPAVPMDVGFLHSSDKFVVLCKGLLDAASLMFYTNQESELGGTTWTCTKTVEKIFGNDAPLKLSTTVHSANSKVLLVVCSATKEAKIFDHNGVVLSAIAPNSFLNYDLGVSYSAKLASIATFTADAKIWELQFSREGVFRGSPKVMDLRGHKSKVNTVAISMDATRAVSVSQDGVMKIWNIDVDYRHDEDPRCLLTVKLDLPDGQYYHRLAFGPELALAAAVKNTIHFLNVETGSVIESVEQAHDSQISSIQWAPLPVKCTKGKIRTLTSSSQDKRVRLWAHPDDIQ
eukprot:g4074.t1